MAVVGKYVKTPIERKRYAIDYSDWLDSTLGENIQSVEMTVSAPGDAMATGSPLQVDAKAISEDRESVAFFVSFGDDGVQYTVDVRVTTSAGQVKEDTVVFSVREPQGV